MNALIHNLLYAQSSCKPIQVGRHLTVSYPDLALINRVIQDWERALEMPSKKPQRKYSGMPDITFVQFKLNSDQKKKFDGWRGGLVEGGIDELTQFMANGNKTSVSWDDQNATWIVSSTCRDEGSVNHNCCLTSRSQDWLAAMLMNVFKSEVIMGATPWRDFADDNTEG